MRPIFGFGGRKGLMQFIFGTPLGPRGVTIGQIAGRKALKKGIRELVGVDDDKKAGEFNPVLGKLSFYGLLAKLSELDKEAPFQSEAQRRKFYAMKSRGEISGATVKKWESHTPKGKKLPERVHKKSAEEKEAILQHLPWLTMMPGKGGLARLARGVGWGSIPAAAGVEAAKQTPPSAMKLTADRLLELTKQSLEFHAHNPSSTDTAEIPDVKKKYLSKSSGQVSLKAVTGLLSPVSPGATSRGISGISRGPSLPSSNWLKRSTSGASEFLEGAGPKGKQMAGVSTEEQVIGAGRAPHVLRAI